VRIVRVHIFTRVAPSCGDLAGWPRTRHHRFAQCGDLGRAEGGHLSEFARVGTGADRSRESVDEAALAVGSEQRVTVFGPARPARSTRRQIDGCPVARSMDVLPASRVGTGYLWIGQSTDWGQRWSKASASTSNGRSASSTPSCHPQPVRPTSPSFTPVGRPRSLRAADQINSGTTRPPTLMFLAVLDLDGGHLPALDKHPVAAVVVHGHRVVLVEPQHQMRPRDQWIGDAQISADVAADSHIFPRGEGVCRPAVPDGSSGAAGWVIGNHSHRRTAHRARLGPLRWYRGRRRRGSDRGTTSAAAPSWRRTVPSLGHSGLLR
jgi:hypothetical protein